MSQDRRGRLIAALDALDRLKQNAVDQNHRLLQEAQRRLDEIDHEIARLKDEYDQEQSASFENRQTFAAYRDWVYQRLGQLNELRVESEVYRQECIDQLQESFRDQKTVETALDDQKDLFQKEEKRLDQQELDGLMIQRFGRKDL